MKIREFLEDNEEKNLSPFACFSKSSKGREREDKKEELRTCFQRDRDRIIHCKAFRRLMHKTQVFLSPEGDHYRTRLTHTLEVAQIARTIARALKLNEDLTEAVALGHDLGHTPFGHAGERALNDLVEGGFRHFEQSVRVAKVLEKDGKGLNLTYETYDGILNHTRGQEAFTLEGRIIRFADRIAYINHDIDDAIIARVLKESDIPSSIVEVLGTSKSKRINTLVYAIVEESKDGQIKMNEKCFEAYNKLHKFMFEKVYLNPYAKKEEKKVPHIIESLYKYYQKPDKLPKYMSNIVEEYGIKTAAADFIAGMTDRYAVYCYENVFIPKSWNIGM